jgi:dimethylargininase
LCGCTYLNSGKMLIVPEFVSGESFPGFEFVKIPRDEAYAVCALSLGEARVMIPSGFPRTTAALKAAGYSPVEVEMSEFYKGDGGVTCLCSPIYKIF